MFQSTRNWKAFQQQSRENGQWCWRLPGPAVACHHFSDISIAAISAVEPRQTVLCRCQDDVYESNTVDEVSYMDYYQLVEPIQMPKITRLTILSKPK